VVWEYDHDLILPELDLHPNTAYVISEYSISIELPGNIWGPRHIGYLHRVGLRAEVALPHPIIRKICETLEIYSEK
jgi:hypothetical protein